MHKDGDLLPWIFGGLAIAAVAMAIAVSPTPRNASIKIPAPLQTVSVALPPPPLPESPNQPAAMPLAIESQPQEAPAAATVNGQIWECVVNGQRTFSNNPCGEKSSLVQVNSVNGMDPTPLRSRVPSYPPEPTYAPDYSYPVAQEPQTSVYPVVIGIPVAQRARPEFMHRPLKHDRAPPPRKY